MKLNHPKPTQLRQKRPNHSSPNAVKNQKYDVFVFLPVVFYEQLKLFFDLYLLLVALKIGLRFCLVFFARLDRDEYRRIHPAYIAPPAFATIGRGLRYLWDKRANSAKYLILKPSYIRRRYYLTLNGGPHNIYPALFYSRW